MLHGVLLRSAIAIAATGLWENAIPPRAACSVLTVEDVRAIVAAPVAVFVPGSFEPKVNGATTFSNCTWVAAGKNSRGARVTLMWGTAAKLTETNQYYAKRGKELSRVSGDVLILASVTDGAASGMTYDRPASEALLTAVLKHLAP